MDHWGSTGVRWSRTLRREGPYLHSGPTQPLLQRNDSGIDSPCARAERLKTFHWGPRLGSAHVYRRPEQEDCPSTVVEIAVVNCSTTIPVAKHCPYKGLPLGLGQDRGFLRSTRIRVHCTSKSRHRTKLRTRTTWVEIYVTAPTRHRSPSLHLTRISQGTVCQVFPHMKIRSINGVSLFPTRHAPRLPPLYRTELSDNPVSVVGLDRPPGPCPATNSCKSMQGGRGVQDLPG